AVEEEVIPLDSGAGEAGKSDHADGDGFGHIGCAGIMPSMRLIKISQQFEAPALADPAAEVRAQLARLDSAVRPGARVGIAVGSRGISNLSAIVKAVCEFVAGK